MRSALGLAEEGSALFGVVAELVAEDAKEALGVAEAAGDFGRRLLLDEVSARASYWRCKGNWGARKKFGLPGVVI